MSEIEHKGRYKKFYVLRYDGDTQSYADFFVLRLDTDEHARVAAWAYAHSIEEENPVLAEDLREAVKSYEKEDDDS